MRVLIYKTWPMKTNRRYKICLKAESVDVTYETADRQYEINERPSIRQSGIGTRACPGGSAV